MTSTSRFELNFFMLPFFMYGGIALQAAGLYLGAILIPFLLWVLGSNPAARFEQPLLAKIGLALLCIWCLYPISNVLNLQSSLAVPGSSELLAPALPWAKLMGSKLPSTWLVSSLFLLLFYGFARMQRQRGSSRTTEFSALASDKPGQDCRCLEFFIKGSSLACLVIGSYLIFQHLTGYDYRFPNSQLGQDRLIGGGSLYRVNGFYGHPLSMASVALAQFAIFASLLMIKFLDGAKQVGASAKGWLWQSQSWPWLAWLTLVHLLFMIMSGGRSAVVVAVLALGLGASWALLRRFSLGKSLVSCVVLSILLLLGLYYSGMIARFNELWLPLQQGKWQSIERLIFWQVHWHIFTDHLWLGRGAAHLSAGVREMYYVLLGYGDLPRKYNAHNFFLETLSVIGLLGTALALSLLRYVLVLLKGWLSRADEKALLYALCVGVVVNAVHGFSQNTFYDASLTVVYFYHFWFIFWLKIIRSRAA